MRLKQAIMMINDREIEIQQGNINVIASKESVFDLSQIDFDQKLIEITAFNASKPGIIKLISEEPNYAALLNKKVPFSQVSFFIGIGESMKEIQLDILGVDEVIMAYSRYDVITLLAKYSGTPIRLRFAKYPTGWYLMDRNKIEVESLLGGDSEPYYHPISIEESDKIEKIFRSKYSRFITT